MLIRNILFVILISISQLVYGQYENLNFKHISVEDGLSQNEVTCISQDNKGYMWIGTLDGLNRFDGYQFKVFKHQANNDSSIGSNKINFVYPDKSGNLWVGTGGGGLNLYNYKTESFKKFVYSDSVKNSISYNNVNCMLELKSGLVLLGTSNGLSFMSTNGQSDNTQITFKNYTNIKINNIVESDANMLWVSSWNGLYQIKIENEIPVVINEYRSNHDDVRNRIGSSDVTKVFIDKDSVIWAGTAKGLEKFTKNKGAYSFVNYGLDDGLPSNNLTDIFEDRNGNFWIGTRGGGLILFDRSNNKFTNIRSNLNFTNSLSSNNISCFFEDQTGILWIGTSGGGINRIDIKHHKFVHYKINQEDRRELPSNFIRAIYKDNDDVIWLGTLNGGFYRYDRKTNIYSNFDFITGNKDKVRLGYNVFDFEEGPANKLWIATSEGLSLYNKNTGKLSYFRKNYLNPDSLKSNSIFAVQYDDNRNLLVGTWEGLHKLIYKNNKACFVRILHEKSNPESISNDVVKYIYNDPLSTDMWICTYYGGLNRMVTDSITGNIKFIHYVFNEDDPKSLSDNKVNMILRSKKGVLWIATDDGLNKMIFENESKKPVFIRYGEKEGLPNSLVQSLTEDNNGNLWLGTNNKLAKFNPETEEFKIFSAEDGLQSNQFSEHTSFKSENGEMFFGGINGFNSFYPDSIKKNTFMPRVVINNLLVFNKPVSVGDTINDHVILKAPLDETKEITLSYKENIITFEFAALHFSSPNKNKYAYKLEGFNSDWLYTDAQNRKATYTNLAGGEYTFRVIASNNDGLWNNEGTSLKLIIIPPWWKTTWFIISFSLVIIGLMFGFFLLRVNALRNQKKILEIKVYERTAELQETNVLLENRQREIEEQDEELKLQKESIELINTDLYETNTRLEERQKQIEEQAETLNKQNIDLNKLNATKDKFFSIIAHDLKSPFNSILGFLELVITSFDTLEEKEKKSLLNIALQSAQNTYKLLENLLHWANSQSGSIKYTPEKFLLEEIIDDNFSLFSELAGKKGIALEKNIQEGIYMNADKNMINLVVRNLLSNSIKFTEKGVITLHTQKTKDAMILEISDTGVGMPPEKTECLFNLEKSVSTKGTGGETGTGLGLIICKDFIDMHNGSIAVKSELGKGTTFTIKIPLNITVEDI